MHIGKMIVVAAVIALVGVAATGLLKPLDLGSNQWERVEPSHLAQLPALQAIAPFIKIEDAVVFGFQDKVYRFQFRVTVKSKFEAALSGGPLSRVTDTKNAMAGIAQTLTGKDGEPDWWSQLVAAKHENAIVYRGMTQPSREVTLIFLNDGWYGQIVEF
jgi:hypothetical protein